MALKHKWRMPIDVESWVLEVRVYDTCEELGEVMTALGVPAEDINDVNSTCVFPVKLRKGQKRIGHLLFALDTVSTRLVLHEMQHVAINLYRLTGREFNEGFGRTGEGAADEEVLCDLMSWTTTVLMWHWRKYVQGVKDEQYPVRPWVERGEAHE